MALGDVSDFVCIFILQPTVNPPFRLFFKSVEFVYLMMPAE